MSYKEIGSDSANRHLSVAPTFEVKPLPEMPHELYASNEPDQPEDVTLRLDRRAVNLLRALAAYDQTNPAEQIRTATTLYLNVRLGDQAVQQFITDHEKQLTEIYSLLLARPESDSNPGLDV